MNSRKQGFTGLLPGLCLSLALSLTVAAADQAPRSWPPDQFAPLTFERISVLPRKQQPAWKAYWEASKALAGPAGAYPPTDFSPLTPIPGPPQGGVYSRGLRLDAPRDWYAGDEARTIADRVVARQTPAGAWTKGIDYTQPAGGSASDDQGVWHGGTFDNEATTAEMRFLARVNAEAGNTGRSAAWREAFLRGLRYIFACQYPNGGYPQVYPLVGGYHDAITFNDGAMRRALEILRDVSTASPEFDLVSPKLRREARRRLALGVDCIVATQLKGKDGRRTVWCAQYDALTLQPCAARNFEPIAAVTWESAELAGFLMTLPDPSPEVVRAVADAVAWFQRTSIPDITWSRFTNDAQVVRMPGAPLMWARCYELDTDKPIFGDRDRTIHYAVAELSTERRAGYTWYGTWPAGVLDKFETWRKQSGTPPVRNSHSP